MRYEIVIPDTGDEQGSIANPVHHLDVPKLSHFEILIGKSP